ncbi:MAG: hypothetical protein DRO88_10745 [Promethearchaeia archaeon]|nr:MAG: hypothetical protein DRO88_10745 [Candidatus Lokiarchaeia archaeon]
MSRSLPNIKYQIKLWVNEQRIPMKPYISNTLGNICMAFLSELKGYKPELLTQIQIMPLKFEFESVKVQVGDQSLELKDFVQKQMSAVISAFISVLDKIPVPFDELKKVEIRITLQKK